jgi:hypothetical protein
MTRAPAPAPSRLQSSEMKMNIRLTGRTSTKALDKEASNTAIRDPKGAGSDRYVFSVSESASRPATPYPALEYASVTSLRPYDRNARTHSRKQIKQIANSIERFGFTNPVLIGNDGQIIAGHGRVEAAKLLKIERIPTLRLSHLSAAERRAYILADKKLAQNAGWDSELLAIELQGLLDIDLRSI